ncbi:hypothetical protein BN439_2985 [Erwinia amylovora Ea644]|nr:hypothetical protein BN439_2985 [Erwinia amylovora Ea644]
MTYVTKTLIKSELYRHFVFWPFLWPGKRLPGAETEGTAIFLLKKAFCDSE